MCRQRQNGLLSAIRADKTTVWCFRVLSGVVELQSVEYESLRPPHVTMATSGSPARRHVDVVPASRRDEAAGPDHDDDNDDDDDDFDENAVTSRRAPASYLRHARMSICKLTSEYISRLPSARTRKDRSATRRERKATKTLAIVLGQLAVCEINFMKSLKWNFSRWLNFFYKST